MKKIISILILVLIAGCTTSQNQRSDDSFGITVDYLGRKWPQRYEHYSVAPDRIPEFIVRAEMKHATMDAGITEPRWLYLETGKPNGDVVIASSFTALLVVREIPISIPEEFEILLEQVLEKNQPYKMNDIPWPFAPPSHAYVLLSKDLFSQVSLTRYGNAFVLQNAFYSSSSYEKNDSSDEFQALGAWATWFKSKSLANFLDENFENDFPYKTPFSKWMSNSAPSTENENGK